MKKYLKSICFSLIMGEHYFLAAKAALEIDLYRQGKEKDFSAIKELTLLVEKYMTRDEDRVSGYNISLPFVCALGLQGPVEEYGLKMKLLYDDLKDIESLGEERLADLEDFCVQLSREFVAERRDVRRWVA